MGIEQAERLIDSSARSIIDKGIELSYLDSNATNSGFFQVIAIVSLVILFGAAIALFIYMIKSNSKNLNWLKEQNNNIVNNIKKELDIDDLQRYINELKDETKDTRNELKKLTDDTKDKTGLIQENISFIQTDLHSIKTELNDKTLELNSHITLTFDKVKAIVESSKQFSDEEMYKFLETRFELSISKIVSEFITLIKKNDLRFNKDFLYDTEIRRIIADNVSIGRDFIYGRNFDKRLLNVIFNNTKNMVDKAEKLVKQKFDIFFSKEINDKDDYKLLEAGIENIGKVMKSQSLTMLKTIILKIDKDKG